MPAKGESKFKNFFNSRLGITIMSLVGLLALLIAFLGVPDYLHRWFTSEHDLNKENRTVSGLLVPEKIINDSKDFTYELVKGTYVSFPHNEIQNGAPFYISQSFCNVHPNPTEQPVNIKFTIKDKK